MTEPNEKPTGYIPQGAELRTADGMLVAVVNTPIFKYSFKNVDDFDWKIPKPLKGCELPFEILEAAHRLAYRYFGQDAT
jgi:hypothetical protein